MREAFRKFASHVSNIAGSALAFLAALLIIVTWAITGPVFNFSNTWQLVINTGTTIVTFLMVFLIQNTQNRDSQAVQIKLDELIRVANGAHNVLMDLEELTEEEILRLKRAYVQLALKGRESLRKGGKDTDAPEIVP